MTIDIVFIPNSHTSYELHKYKSFKRYRFICTYSYIKVGDVITSPDYSKRMLVTDVNHNDAGTSYLGIPLKIINISTVNIHKSERNNMNNTVETNKRTIEVPLQTAIEWYNSDNKALKEVALTAFTKKELEDISYMQIMKEIAHKVDFSIIPYPIKELNEVQALARLRNLAYYFNNGWKKEESTPGFFLARMVLYTPISRIKDQLYDWSIFKLANVKYPGIIYFKSKEVAIKALKIAYKEGWLNDLK